MSTALEGGEKRGRESHRGASDVEWRGRKEADDVRHTSQAETSWGYQQAEENKRLTAWADGREWDERDEG